MISACRKMQQRQVVRQAQRLREEFGRFLSALEQLLRSVKWLLCLLQVNSKLRVGRWQCTVLCRLLFRLVGLNLGKSLSVYVFALTAKSGTGGILFDTGCGTAIFW